jgi:hypothetical protein
LKDYFELPPAERFPNQLVPVAELLVSPNLEIRKEALDRFLKSDRVLRELVALKSYSKSDGMNRRQSATSPCTTFALRITATPPTTPLSERVN